eukprot:gnl/MRDRNA2_/MRDRNA2_31382_c0_seq1.p1 gnl/MRDRNA2_/MRDRNA2_31382_c0~~gnl/MRDRNA2_/MRDRNA2_31382_c0_seq1.p1  ORF type:complete len:741 (+),score=193.92 gnl/MRDRNA2_/MRDRNA2_31382_c0_seq1:42-2264(+)
MLSLFEKNDETKPIPSLVKKNPGRVFACTRSLVFHQTNDESGLDNTAIGSSASQVTLGSIRSGNLRSTTSSRTTLPSNRSSRQLLASNQSSAATLTQNNSGFISDFGTSSVISKANSSSTWPSQRGKGSRQCRIFANDQCSIGGGWAFRYAEFQGVVPIPKPQKQASKHQELPHSRTRAGSQREEHRESFIITKGEETIPEDKRWAAKIAPAKRTVKRRFAITGLDQSKLHVKSGVRLFGRRNFEKLVKLRKITNLLAEDEEEEEEKKTPEEMLADLAKETGLDSNQCQEMRTLFDKYDQDKSGVLDRTEVEVIFADKGMEPRTREEKMEINELLCEVDRDGSGEFSLFEFGLVMVKVDAKMRQLQLADLQQKFLEADKDGSGELETLEVLEILEKLSLGPKNDDERELIQTCIAVTDQDESGEVNFDEFQQLVRKIRVDLTVLRRLQEKQIAQDHRLGPQLFEEFRPELVILYQAFCRYDKDKSGLLDKEESMAALNDIGLLPKTRVEREEVEQLMRKMDADGDQELNFREFLVLMSQAKIMIREKRQQELRTLFESYDSDQSGELGAAEIVKIIEDFGIQPKTRQEQDQIKEVLQEVDEDGSGSLEFNEFQTLIQRIMVRLQRMERDAQIKVASDLGFSTMQVKEYRTAFDTLDPEGSGALNITAVRQVLRMLSMNVSSDELRQIFDELDEDSSGYLEFAEFLHFIKMTEKKAAKWQHPSVRRSLGVDPEALQANQEK